MVFLLKFLVVFLCFYFFFLLLLSVCSCFLILLTHFAPVKILLADIQKLAVLCVKENND